MTRSNEAALQEKLYTLLEESGVTQDKELAADMLQAVIKLARDEPGRGEMKLMDRSLKELRYAFKVFKPYRQRPLVGGWMVGQTEFGLEITHNLSVAPRSRRGSG